MPIYARAGPRAVGARPAAARPRRGRARHAVPRHPAPLFGERRRPARRRRRCDALLAKRPRMLRRDRRCPPMSRRSGGRASHRLAEPSSPGRASAPTACSAARPRRAPASSSSAHPASPCPAMPTASTCWPAGMADILDYKTGSSPSKGQAHTLLAPQLALEGALLRRGAFERSRQRWSRPTSLFVRLKPNGEVDPRIDPRAQQEPAQARRSLPRTPGRGWKSCCSTTTNPRAGYLSRALPFREGEIDGDYDHLARVLEWSAGGDGDDGGRRRMSGPIRQVPGETARLQASASDPKNSVWVSANAGSGKTHVLAQRVIRLLLTGTDPSRILCLTYTRAAAANMSNRVFSSLSRMDDARRRRAGGEDRRRSRAARPTRRSCARARRLFAEALETPGGLKIQTIHAFCEAVLHQFPLEANIAAHFEMLDQRMEADAVRRGAARDADRRRRRQCRIWPRPSRRCWSAAASPGSTLLLQEIVRQARRPARLHRRGPGGRRRSAVAALRRVRLRARRDGRSRSPAPSGRCRAFAAGLFARFVAAGARPAMRAACSNNILPHAARGFAETDPVRRLQHCSRKGFLKADGEPYDADQGVQEGAACRHARPAGALRRGCRRDHRGDATGWRSSACWRARAPRSTSPTG